MSKELLVCLPTPIFGGHERMVVRILAALARADTRIIVVCRPLPQLLEELAAVPGVEVRPVLGGTTGASSMRETWKALRPVRRSVPVLFAPGMMLSHRDHLIAAALMGRRVLAYVPTCQKFGSALLWGWFADRLAARLVSRWFTITGPIAESLRTHRHVRGPVDVIPNIVPDPVASAVPPDAATDGRLRVMFLGRYDTHSKGLDWLAAALRETRAQWTGWMRFAFHGDGVGRPLLEALAGDCGPGNVVVNGWSDSYSALAGADLMILPSRTEGFPLVFIEAAKAGVPVLASRFTGAAELLGDGAWLDVGDAAGLLKALERLRDESLRRQVASVQRATVLAHADEAKFATAIAALHSRL